MVTIVNKAGHGKDFAFSDLPVPEPMQRSLATVFAAQQVRWTSHYSATAAWNRLKVFAEFISGLDTPPEDLTGLDAATLKRWRLQNISTNTGRTTLRVVHRILRSYPRLSEGPVAEELARRVPAPKPVRKSYDEAEREHVLLAAGRQFRAAWLRIRENSELLERWRAGALDEGSHDWRLGEALDHVARVGDVPRTQLPSGRQAITNRGLLGGRDSEHTWGRLFLTPSELTALAVLLTDRFGWNLSVYDRMPAPTRAPSVAETTNVTYHVQVEKRRAGNGRWFSTENITDSGADSPGRLITQALQATLHGRLLASQLAPGTDLLMTARAVRQKGGRRDMDRPPVVGPLVFGVSGVDGKSWASEHKLGGSPFRQIRRTTVTREGKPLQHTQGTHESIYVLPDQKVRQDSQQIFEDGALEALDQAKKIFFGGHLAPGPDPAHGQTATADCADEDTTPWPAPGGGCGADFLLCLACPNAHIHPGHHPRLALLHEQIQSLRSAMNRPGSSGDSIP
ncbi:hypothetical protein [Streptomyces sp. NBC_00102]|uniref:hypothetical protein n=1 Tax=Streptomyces sp. NBC_00102 TaxID=2975652 RepID=UPI002255DBC2|nr:hypothetical protein [Streptomyces sp. NBC_00102]MCX5401228.1 hypothetical protein [Streptomyces sp. NBC_00102]